MPRGKRKASRISQESSPSVRHSGSSKIVDEGGEPQSFVKAALASSSDVAVPSSAMRAGNTSTTEAASKSTTPATSTAPHQRGRPKRRKRGPGKSKVKRKEDFLTMVSTLGGGGGGSGRGRHGDHDDHDDELEDSDDHHGDSDDNDDHDDHDDHDDGDHDDGNHDDDGDDGDDSATDHGGAAVELVKMKGSTDAAATKKPTNGETTYGSHFTGKRKSVANDEWQTTEAAWAPIVKILMTKYRPKSRVWQPFYYDGACAEHVRSLGFANVIHEDVDFFKRAQDEKFLKRVDLILDNPPYTGPGMKERVLRALVATEKPFVMLLPSSVLFSKLVRDTLDMSKVQCVIPRRVPVCKTGEDPVNFKFLVWLCYRVGMPSDMVFVE